MIFKKNRKESRKKERNDAWDQQENNFDTAIKEAGKITDPAEKVLTLREIARRVSIQILSESDAISKDVRKKEKKMSLAVGGPTVAAIVGSCILTGPVGWACLSVGTAGFVFGKEISDKRGQSVRKKLEKEANDHIKCMKGQLDLVAEMTDTTIENNVKEISKSPLYENIVAFSDLASKFAAAAAKRIANEEEVPPVESVPPADAAVPPVEAPSVTDVKEPEPEKKQKANYDKLISFTKIKKRPQP